MSYFLINLKLDCHFKDCKFRKVVVPIIGNLRSNLSNVEIVKPRELVRYILSCERIYSTSEVEDLVKFFERLLVWKLSKFWISQLP